MDEDPVVTAEEVFGVDGKIRWVALTSNSGRVILNEMRPGVESATSEAVDESLSQLGPLTVLGVVERYSQYLKGVDWVTVHFGLMTHVYSRLGSQVISVSVENDRDAIGRFEAWLERKRGELQGR